MKKVFFTCLGLCAAGFVSAQEVKSETQVEETVEVTAAEGHFLKNWFVTVQGGGNMYFGDHDRQCKFGDRIAGTAGFSVGKWVSPVVGIRANYIWAGQRGATKWEAAWEDTGFGPTGVDIAGKGAGTGHNLQGQKFSFGNVSVEAMLNLSNLFAGYKEDRFYNCIPYIGVGFAHVYSPSGDVAKVNSNINGKGREASANLGIFNSFRLNKSLDLNIDLRSMYVNDRFDAEGGGRFGEGDLSVSVGLTYKFNKRGFGNDRVITRTIRTDYSEKELVVMRDKMNQLMADNKRMQDELAAAKSVEAMGKVSETQRTVVAPNLVVFEINRSELSKDARVNLGMFAEMIKACDKDVVYTISGYADKGTGSVERNARLSQERAQAVYDCLTKEFGVNPAQLKIVANGGVDNMFYNDPRLSRAVISRAETK